MSIAESIAEMEAVSAALRARDIAERPRVGEWVHYVNASVCMAALIVKVQSPTFVELEVHPAAYDGASRPQSPTFSTRGNTWSYGAWHRIEECERA